MVYKIPLKCGNVYVGQTGRCPNDRLREHSYACKQTAAPSNPAMYRRMCKWTAFFDKTTVVVKEKDKMAREIREALEIDEENDNFVSTRSVMLTLKLRSLTQRMHAHTERIDIIVTTRYMRTRSEIICYNRVNAVAMRRCELYELRYDLAVGRSRSPGSLCVRLISSVRFVPVASYRAWHKKNERAHGLSRRTAPIDVVLAQCIRGLKPRWSSQRVVYTKCRPPLSGSHNSLPARKFGASGSR